MPLAGKYLPLISCKIFVKDLKIISSVLLKNSKDKNALPLFFFNKLTLEFSLIFFCTKYSIELLEDIRALSLILRDYSNFFYYINDSIVQKEIEEEKN